MMVVDPSLLQPPTPFPHDALTRPMSTIRATDGRRKHTTCTRRKRTRMQQYASLCCGGRLQTIPSTIPEKLVVVGLVLAYRFLG